MSYYWSNVEIPLGREFIQVSTRTSHLIFELLEEFRRAVLVGNVRSDVWEVLCALCLIEDQGILESRSFFGFEEGGVEEWGNLSNGFVNTLCILRFDIKSINQLEAQNNWRTVE